MTDAGLVYLERLSNLRQVWLNDTQVTDAGVLSLKNLPALTQMTVGKQVTESAIAEFQAAARKCTIYWEGRILSPRQ